MQSEALTTATRRGEEIRYVTEHFRDLQGLYFASVWAGLFMLVFLWFPTRPSGIHLLFVFGIAALFPLVGVSLAHAWYKRYGMVKGTPEIQYSKPLSILDTSPPRRRYAPGLVVVWLGIWIVFTGTILFHRLDEYRAALNLWIALALTVPRCFYPAPAISSIQLRRVLYITSSAIIFFSILSVPFMGPLHSSEWLLLEIVCATLLVLSLYDHWLLSHLLRARPEAFYD